MTYSPSDFGPGKSGPQFALLDARLTIHGYPPLHALDSIKDRTQRWQLAQGWTGTELGGNADGYIGPVSWRRLQAEPPRAPAGIDLSLWKITLPTGDEEDPTEIFPIGTHEDAPWFVNHGEAGLTFRAPVNGVTTSRSGYPRSELREMDADGDEAEWSSTSGTHVLSGEFAITRRPGLKPHVVCAQIHDERDDVVMVRLEGTRLFVESRGEEMGDLDLGYGLHERFDLTITATKAGIKVEYHNPLSGSAIVNVPLVGSGWYFKAGCYTQANESNGTGEGEVVIYRLNLSHAA